MDNRKQTHMLASYNYEVPDKEKMVTVHTTVVTKPDGTTWESGCPEADVVKKYAKEWGLQFEVKENKKLIRASDWDAVKDRIMAALDEAGQGGHYSYVFPAIKTPKSLGSEEHLRRRGILEKALSDLGLEWTVECQTIWGDDVCKPVVR